MKDKNFSRNYEEQLAQKSDVKVIEVQHNVSTKVWKVENVTHLQILRNGLSKGCYGRLSYRGNPQAILSDLARALSLTCGMEFESVSSVASELIEKLKVYEREVYQKMKQQREQMMMKEVNEK